MQFTEIAALRLFNQRLLGKKCSSPHDAVSWLGAVQAQDFPAAKWSLGQRVAKATDQSIEQAYNDGKILRTHIMRPTWHFVTPENLRWMQKLTSPGVLKMNAHMNRKLELNEQELVTCMKVFEKILQNHHFQTREELGRELEKNRITALGQRLAYIVMRAELDAVICSGPRRGKQFTYALVDERTPRTVEISREEALGKLALVYFQSHGPAQVADFSWWSGLSRKDVEAAISLTKARLSKEIVDDKTYWFVEKSLSKIAASRSTFLLSIYDEYTIAYRDRSVLGGERYFERLIRMGNALTAVVVVDGKIVGTWKRKLKKNTVEVTLDVFHKLKHAEKLLLKQAESDYKKFVGF